MPTPPNGDGSKAESRGILEAIFGPPSARGFRVRFWDGEEEGPEGQAPFALVLRHPGALRRMFLPPTERRLGEAFVRDDFDVTGDIEAAAALVDPIERAFGSLPRALALAGRLRRLPSNPPVGLSTDATRADPAVPARPSTGKAHSRERDERVVRFHYDVGNDFYRLWLDERMVYSCGYFPSGDESLDEAQEGKLDLICRKLRLSPGERLLDIGCGWGSLVVHAAKRYGARATGITLSEPQARLGRDRIERAGLGDRCRIEIRDYRELPPGARFDKIASVGMVEHVGRRMLPTYFREAARLLEPGGLFLNHGIVTLEQPLPAWRRTVRRGIRRWTSFVDRYVFPDGELVPLSRTLDAAERAGLETRDVENLREHYAVTLRCWLRRLEANREEAVARAGETAYRIWRLYLAVSAFQFSTARVALAQSLLARPDARGGVRIPPSRDDLYRGSAGDPPLRESRPGSPWENRRRE